MIDRVGQRRAQVAERIIGQTRQMDHRVDAVEVARLDVADVLADGRHVADMPERALPEQAAVQTHDVVAHHPQPRTRMVPM